MLKNDMKFSVTHKSFRRERAVCPDAPGRSSAPGGQRARARPKELSEGIRPRDEDLLLRAKCKTAEDERRRTKIEEISISE